MVDLVCQKPQPLQTDLAVKPQIALSAPITYLKYTIILYITCVKDLLVIVDQGLRVERALSHDAE